MIKSLSTMAHCKREGDLQDDDPSFKKFKVAGLNAESEKAKEILDTHVSVSADINCQKATTDEQVNAKDDKKDNQKHKIINPIEATAICKPEELRQQGSMLSDIDADAAEDKGTRHAMEDAWVVLPDASLEFPGKLRCAHFAIYDGHGGRLAAEFAQKHLHQNVLSAGLPRELMDIKAAKGAILEGFRRTDKSLLEESAKGNWQDGATAVCLWILGQTVLVANIGDAKAVLARSANGTQTSREAGMGLKAIVLTREHKAIYPQERARIQKGGGSVGPNGRLQGRLEVSRAFGDRQFKKVGVIATPDIHSFELTEKEQFVILGCDGLWGVFGPSDAVDFVQKQLKETSSAASAARRLVKEAVRERHCKDNCTAVVIAFKHN